MPFYLLLYLIAFCNSRYESWIVNYEKNIVSGLGEYGIPAYLNDQDKLKGELSLKQKALNVFLSAKISLKRNLPDPRHPL